MADDYRVFMKKPNSKIGKFLPAACPPRGRKPAKRTSRLPKSRYSRDDIEEIFRRFACKGRSPRENSHM